MAAASLTRRWYSTSTAGIVDTLLDADRSTDKQQSLVCEETDAVPSDRDDGFDSVRLVNCDILPGSVVVNNTAGEDIVTPPTIALALN
jgi:hypothetical protein